MVAALFLPGHQASAQESAISAALVESVTGGLSVNLIGYGMTSIGLNSEAAYETDVESQLAAINNVGHYFRAAHRYSKRHPDPDLRRGALEQFGNQRADLDRDGLEYLHATAAGRRKSGRQRQSGGYR